MYDYPWLRPDFKWNSAIGAGDAWIKAVGRMQVEAAALMTRRMLAAVEFPQAVTQCKTPMDAIAQQVVYWQTAQRQYLQSLERMSSLCTDALVRAAPGVPASTGLNAAVKTSSSEVARKAPAVATKPQVVAQTTTPEPMNRTTELTKPHSVELRKAKHDAANSESVRADLNRPDTEAEVAAWLYRKSA